MEKLPRVRAVRDAHHDALTTRAPGPRHVASPGPPVILNAPSLRCSRCSSSAILFRSRDNGGSSSFVSILSLQLLDVDVFY